MAEAFRILKSNIEAEANARKANLRDASGFEF